MIADLNDFVLLVIGGSSLLVMAGSLLSRYLHWKSEVKLTRARTVCRLCGNVYLAEHSGNLTHCPECDGLNTRVSNGRLG